MCQIDVCTCTRLFETMPGVQPPSRSPTTLSPANHPRRTLLFHETATILTVPHTNPYRYLYALPPTTHIARLSLSSPSARHPIALNFVSTASLLLPSATHTTATTTHSFHPSRTLSFSLFHPLTYLSLSLSVSTSVFLKRPIQSTRRVRPYGAVSTGTPARSLKENAIIRRTSTNELIVGASRYRQYREVLYSTSPGATRL